jgi:hypothetical protein
MLSNKEQEAQIEELGRRAVSESMDRYYYQY